MNNKPQNSFDLLAEILGDGSVAHKVPQLYLSRKPIIALPAEDHVQIHEFINEVTNIKVEDLDSVVLIALHRNPVSEDKPCEGCGEVHETGSMVTSMVAGGDMALKALMLMVMDEIDEKISKGDFGNGLSPQPPAPRTPQ